jgi:hypothetical protein
MTAPTPAALCDGPEQAICGQSGMTVALGMTPERTNGCGRSVSGLDLFRCADCRVPFHRDCLRRHCGDGAPHADLETEVARLTHLADSLAYSRVEIERAIWEAAIRLLSDHDEHFRAAAQKTP